MSRLNLPASGVGRSLLKDSLRLWLVFVLALGMGCGSGTPAPESAAGDGSAETASAEAASAATTEATAAEGSSGGGATLPSGGLTSQPMTGLSPPPVPSLPTDRDPRPLMLGSFNIQRFGETKSGKAVVMDQLMDLVYPFDVLAIQEVVSQKEAVVQNFVARLNEKYNGQFNYVIGPFVGRTTYVERFAYIYDSRRIKLVEQPFIIADPDDKFHREPLVARFQVRDELHPRPFSFAMVNVHLDPQDAVVEMNHLADVLSRLESLYQDQEDDILLVGDFNLSPGKILSETPFSTRPSWKPVLDDRVPTNTRQDKAYDNILLHSDRTSEFLGRCGVIDLQQRFRISLEEALEISDHLPVWAAFTLSEAESANVAAQATDAALR